MAETTFALEYDGPALDDGKMPVRDLAPALLALGELFAEASAVLYPERDPVALNIKATEEGSFLVQLILESREAWDRIIDLFGTDGATSLANLKELVIGGEIGLFYLIKWLHGRRIVDQQPIPDSGLVRLTLDDQTSLEVPSDVMKLYSNVELRKKAREVVAPVRREGVETVSFKETETVLVIGKPDTESFELPPEDGETLLDQIQEMILEITTLSFAERNKWRLSDGARSITALIEDEDFLERVASGHEAFRYGDMLRCRMRIIQRRSNNKLSIEYRVVEVIEHVPRQPQLHFEAPE